MIVIVQALNTNYQNAATVTDDGAQEAASMDSPLIIAVAMDESTTQQLTAWRRRFFPPERNHLPAHLMVYHRLEGGAIQRIKKAVAAAVLPSFLLNFTRVRGAGGFVGVDVESPTLQAIKQHLDEVLNDLLVPQDRQRYRPHVTLVNKVDPIEATRSLSLITAEFVPFSAPAVGLELHAYEGGPWQLLERYSFS